MQDQNHSLNVIAKGSIVIFMGIMLSKVFSYVYRIIVSRLGPSDYGIFSLAIAIFGIIGGITMLGTETGLVKFISGYGQKKESIKGVIHDAIRFVIPLSIILAVLLFLFSDYIAIKLFRKEELSIFLKVLAIFVPVNALRKIFLNSLIGFKSVQYETLAKAITENVSKVAITFILMLFGYGLFGAVIGYAISILASLVLSFYLLRYKVFNFMDKGIKEVYSTKEFYKYSLPLLFSIIVFIFMLWTDTLLLGYFKTPVEVGIYSAAMPTAQLLFIFPNALMVIFLPVISGMQDFKSPEFATVFRIVTKWIFLVNIIPLALFIIYPRQILSIVFGNAYSSGDASLVILSMGFFISHLALSSNNVLLALGKTKLVFMNNFIGSIANLVLNILLIPKYGIIGASVATSFSFVLMSLLMFAESWHFTKIMPFNLNILKSVFSIIISLLLVNYLVGRYSISNISSIILASVLLLLLYAIFLFVTKALEKEDYYILNNIYKKMGIKIGIIDDFFSRME